MFRCAGQIAIALALTACTQQVVLRDVPNASDAAVTSRDVGPGSDASCLQKYTSLRYWPQPAQVMIVLDRSAAMQSSFGNTTRGGAAQTALATAVQSFTARIKFGFEQFPTDPSEYQCQTGTCCAEPVSIDPNTYNDSYVSKSIQCGDAHGFGCPATSADSASHKALAMVRDYYRAKYPPTSDDVYVLLVTSSEPACTAEGNDACSSARSVASDLGEAGVRIIVLSVGQPAPNSCLSQISNKGSLRLPDGTQSLYAVNSFNELSNALTGLFSAIAKNACTLTSTTIPPSQTLTVYIGDKKFSQTDGNNQDGWSYSNPNHTSIVLSGSACDEWLKKTQLSYPEVGYSCSPCGGPSACNTTWP